jgi:hypothetical protein
MRVTFLTFFLEVPGSNLGPNTKSSVFFRGVLQSLYENDRTVPHNHAASVRVTKTNRSLEYRVTLRLAVYG